MSKIDKNAKKEEILKIVKEAKRPIGLTEVSSRLDLIKQTTLNYLNELMEETPCLIRENKKYSWIDEKTQFIKSKIENALKGLKESKNKKEKTYQIEELLEIYTDYQPYEINLELLRKHAKETLFIFESALEDEKILEQREDINIRLLIGIKYILKRLKIKELKDNSQIIKIAKDSKNDSNKKQAIEILGSEDKEENIDVLVNLIKNMPDEDFYKKNYAYVFKYSFSYMEKAFEKAKQKLHDLACSNKDYKDKFEHIYRETRGIKKREKLGDSELI